jgi:hypothetical protein
VGGDAALPRRAATRARAGGRPVSEHEDLVARMTDRFETPVPDLAEILADVMSEARRYVVFASDAQAVAVALWIAHAHAIEAADVTAYLDISSPAKRSGKTRLLEFLELVVPRPLRTANISDAALFRIIDEARPVILLDEADAIFGPKSDREDLRALLNAGYRRGSEVVRCEANGRAQVVRRFDAFAAKAIAAIGDLPETVADRSVPIRLQRRAPGESVERFRYREASAAAEPIRSRLAAWAANAVDALREARPELPDVLNDRAQDGWEPLLAIADAAGDVWPNVAREAAATLHVDTDDWDRSAAILRDLHVVFDAAGGDRLSSADAVAALNGLEESPWGGWPLQARGLARLLRPYGVHSTKIRIGEATMRGYLRADLDGAWSRYLTPQKSGTRGTSGTAQVAPTSGVPDVADVPLSQGVREPDGLDHTVKVIQTERHRGRTDAEILELLNAQPRSFAPPSGFTRWNREALVAAAAEPGTVLDAW